MKLYKTIVLLAIITLLGSTTVQAQTFVKVNGLGTDIAVGPKYGHVYVVGTSKNVFKYDSRSKRFKPFSAQTKNASRIAVGGNGGLYMVNTSGKVNIDVNGRYNPIPNIKTNDVTSDAHGTPWAADDYNGDVPKYLQNGKWVYPYNKQMINVKRIAVNNGKKAWLVLQDKSIYAWVNNAWKKMPGKATDIAIDINDSNAYIVGTSKRIFKWNASLYKWEVLPGTRNDVVNISANKRKLWCTTTSNKVYYYDKNRTNTAQTTRPKTKDLSGTYKVYIDKLGAFTKDCKFYGTMGVYLEATIASGKSTIKPLHNQANRYWDVSKTRPEPANGPGFTVNVTINHNKKDLSRLVGSLNIDKVREFRIIGEAAKGNPTFDFQFNMKKVQPLKSDRGEWQRLKLPLKDIVLGKKYFYWDGVSPSIVSFKIEKID